MSKVSIRTYQHLTIGLLLFVGTFSVSVAYSNAPLSAAQSVAVIERFKQALQYQQAGKETEAAQLYAELTREYPHLIAPFINLAAVYAQSGQLNRARETLEAALEADQKNKKLFSGLQQIYGAQAAQSYHQALGSSARAPNRLTLSVVESLGLVAPTPAVSGVPLQNIVKLEETPETKAEIARLRAQVARLTEDLRETQNSLLARETDLQNANRALIQSEATRDALSASAAQAQNVQVVPNVAAPVVERTDINRVMALRVQSWAKAWSDQNVQAYVSHYADSYTTYGLTRQQWLAQRRDRLTGRTFIEVDVSDFEVIDHGGEVSVTFLQRYRSDSFDDSIRKKLVFAKNPDAIERSKIVIESIVST